jgi:WD40 repeat protein
MHRIIVVACCVFSLAGGARLGLGAPKDTPQPKDTAVPELDGVSAVDLAGHTQEIGCAAFSRDAKLVATGCYDRKVRVFDVSAGKVLDTFEFGDEASNKPDKLGVRTQGRQNAVAFDPEGKKIVAAGGNWLSPDPLVPNSLATVFDLTTKKAIFTSRTHDGMISAAAFSPDGKILVTACHDGTLKVFDAAAGKERGTFKGHDWVVTATTFAPDGKTIASVNCNSIKRSVKLWDPLTLRESLNIPLPDRIPDIHDLTFSPDGKQIAGVSNWRLHVWDAATGKQVADALLDSGMFTRLAYSPDGKRIVIAGGQGGGAGKCILHLYDIATKDVHLLIVKDLGKDLIAVSWPLADKILAVSRRDNAVKLVTTQLKN